MSTRERICAIEIEDEGMLHDAADGRGGARSRECRWPPLPKPDTQMLAIAEKIVDQQAASSNPSDFVDRYERAARPDRGQEEGHVISPRSPQRRHQGGRPDGGGWATASRWRRQRERAERFVASPRAAGYETKKTPSRRSAA